MTRMVATRQLDAGLYRDLIDGLLFAIEAKALTGADSLTGALKILRRWRRTAERTATVNRNTKGV